MPAEARPYGSTDGWPEEFYLEGPVPDGEELLRRTVARVHKHSARSVRIRLALTATGVLVASAALTGTGIVVGRFLEGPAVVAETVITGSDPRSGARLAVAMTPTDDGTRMDVTVTGLPVGTACQLTYVGTDGSRLSHNGSWRIPPDAAHRPAHEHVWMTESQLAAVEVTTSTGTELVARTN